MLPVDGSQPQALGEHAFAGCWQVVPERHCASLLHGGSKFAQSPASGLAPASAAAVHWPPPQSAVQMTRPVCASQPQAEGTHCAGSRRHTRPAPHIASELHGGSKPAQLPASAAPGRHTPPPQSAVHTTAPLDGSQPHADGLHWLWSRTHRFPGPHWVSLLHGGTKPTQKPASGRPASGATPASRGSHTPPPQSAVQMTPLGPHAHALGWQTPGLRTHASPRTHSESLAHGARNPTHAPASGEPASRDATRHTPPPQSSVQMMLPVDGSHPHADGLHSFGSRTQARPGPH